MKVELMKESKTYTYENESEMNRHIEFMVEEGWSWRHCGYGYVKVVEFSRKGK